MKPGSSKIAFAMILALAQSANAALITVDDPGDVNLTLPHVELVKFLNDGKCTLREAIENANKDSNNLVIEASADCEAGSGTDEIEFLLGPQEEIKIAAADDPYYLSSPLKITGSATDTKISGESRSRIFEIGTASQIDLNKLTLQRGSEKDGGGGGAVLVNTSAAEVYFTGVNFYFNKAKGIGGAVATSGATLSFILSNFKNNFSEATGGDIGGGGDIDIYRGKHERGRAQGGGAIHCTSGKLTMTLSLFDHNRAYGNKTPDGWVNGGGAVMSGCNTLASNVKVVDNKAGGDLGGGAFYLTAASSGEVRDSYFVGNSVGKTMGGNGTGGAILSFGHADVKRSTFYDNEVQSESNILVCGGGIHFSSAAKSKVMNSSIISNKVRTPQDIAIPFGEEPSGNGAGVCASGNADVELLNSTVKNNEGDSEVFVKALDNALIKLKNTIIDGGGTHLNCATDNGDPVIFDGEPGEEVGYNLQFDDSALTASHTPSCLDVIATSDTKLQLDHHTLGKVAPVADLKHVFYRPLVGSPAIGVGNPAVCAAVGSVDQNFAARISCSKGAIEVPPLISIPGGAF